MATDSRMDPTAHRLIHNLHHPTHGSPYQYVAVVTGGGAQAMAMLLGVHGASKAVLEVLVPLHQRSLVGLLGRVHGQNCYAVTAALMAQSTYVSTSSCALGSAYA